MSNNKFKPVKLMKREEDVECATLVECTYKIHSIRNNAKNVPATQLLNGKLRSSNLMLK